MPTAKPRLNVTFDPDDYAVIRELAELNSSSMSSVVAELVHDVVPMLENVVRAGRAFRAASNSVNEDVRAAFEEADQILGPEIASLQADILERLQEIAVLAGPEAEPDPRPVIRGSRTPTPHLLPVPRGRQS